MIDVVGIAEVAAMAGLTRQRIQQLASAGQMPVGKKLSSGWVWETADIEAWLAARRGDTETATDTGSPSTEP